MATGEKRLPWWKRWLRDSGWAIIAGSSLHFSGFMPDARWWEVVALFLLVYSIARLACNDRIEG